MDNLLNLLRGNKLKFIRSKDGQFVTITLLEDKNGNLGHVTLKNRIITENECVEYYCLDCPEYSFNKTHNCNVSNDLLGVVQDYLNPVECPLKDRTAFEGIN